MTKNTLSYTAKKPDRPQLTAPDAEFWTLHEYVDRAHAAYDVNDVVAACREQAIALAAVSVHIVPVVTLLTWIELAVAAKLAFVGDAVEI